MADIKWLAYRAWCAFGIACGVGVAIYADWGGFNAG